MLRMVFYSNLPLRARQTLPIRLIGGPLSREQKKMFLVIMLKNTNYGNLNFLNVPIRIFASLIAEFYLMAYA